MLSGSLAGALIVSGGSSRHRIGFLSFRDGEETWGPSSVGRRGKEEKGDCADLVMLGQGAGYRVPGGRKMAQ
jgi:hypothetical protein